MRSALLLAAVLAAFTACKKESDEDLIKAVVRAAIEGANEKRASTVVENAADDFKGPGQSDLQESRRILTGFFLRKGWIRVFERELTITVTDATHATAKLQAVIAEGQEVKSLEDVLPTNGTVLDFDLTLEKRDGEWKFVASTYRRARAPL